MKFTINHVGKSGRLGSLSGVSKRQSEALETPLITMYTRGGNLPHITHEVLHMITTDNLIMHMPLTTIFTAFSGIEALGQGISEFVGLKEYPSFITPQDPAVETPSGYNISNQVAVWCKNGKRAVDPLKYMTMMESMKPDIYFALCDGDTDVNSSKKRVLKSVKRSSKLFEECYKHHQASEVLKNVAMLAPLEGGYDLNARRVFTEEIAKYDVHGYFLDGLHTNGTDVEQINYGTIGSIVTESLARLPEEKLRVVHGAWNPVTLLHLVAAGFDMFDTSLPYLSTERGSALSFSFDESTSINSTNPLKSGGVWYEMCLENIIYLEDFQPILKDCNCLTCRHHTRAYIHHLLKSQELLGKVLLMVHNFHHYLEFFKSIRRAIKNDSLDSLCTFIKSQCPCS